MYVVQFYVFLNFFHLTVCKYTENILLERLFDGYRLAFHKSENCKLSTERVNHLLYKNHLENIPDQCLGYVKGNGQHFQFFDAVF